jgi:hypothetical protein
LSKTGALVCLLWTVVPPVVDIRPHLGAPFNAFSHSAAELLVAHFIADICAFRFKIDIAIDKLLNHRTNARVDEFLTDVGHETLRPISRRRRCSEEWHGVCGL